MSIARTGQHDPGEKGAHSHGQASCVHEESGAQHDQQRTRSEHLARSSLRQQRKEGIQAPAGHAQEQEQRTDRHKKARRSPLPAIQRGHEGDHRQ